MKTQPVNPNIDMAAIAQRLYTIRNIANLAVMCPQEDAEVYILQDIFEHVSQMIQSLLEDVENEF